MNAKKTRKAADPVRRRIMLVKDIAPGPGASGMKSWYHITSNGSYLLFNAIAGAEGYELWRSDGSEAGTSLLIVGSSSGWADKARQKFLTSAAKHNQSPPPG